jgi:hypothetical protein
MEGWMAFTICVFRSSCDFHNLRLELTEYRFASSLVLPSPPIALYSLTLCVYFQDNPQFWRFREFRRPHWVNRFLAVIGPAYYYQVNASFL